MVNEEPAHEIHRAFHECPHLRPGLAKQLVSRQARSRVTSPGVAAQTTGSRGLCLHMLTIPRGGRAKPHLHENHESAVFVLSGEAGMWYGEGLREHMWTRSGDFVYIPANMPHMPYNASDREPCVAIIARTDPNEQESVTLLALARFRNRGALRQLAGSSSGLQQRLHAIHAQHRRVLRFRNQPAHSRFDRSPPSAPPVRRAICPASTPSAPSRSRWTPCSRALCSPPRPRVRLQNAPTSAKCRRMPDSISPP